MTRRTRVWRLSLLALIAAGCSLPRPSPVESDKAPPSPGPSVDARIAEAIELEARERLTAAEAPPLPVCDEALRPLLGAAEPPLPQEPGALELGVVGQIGGPVHAVTVAGNDLLVGVGPRVVSLELGAALRQTAGSPLLAGTVVDVVTGGRLIVAALGPAGVAVLEPDAGLSVVGQVATPGNARSAALVGDIAYVAAGPAGLRLVDFGNPAEPLELEPAVGGRSVLGVSIESGLAFLAMGDEGIAVLDVTAPRRPRTLADVALGGYANAVTVRNGVAYVADGWGGVKVVDVSDPVRPRVIATVETMGWAHDISLDEDTAYVAAGSEGLVVVNVTDPAAPQRVAGLQLAGRQATRIAVVDDLALVVDPHEGLQIVDVATAGVPRAAGSWQPVIEAAGIALAGQHAYVAAGRAGIRVIDVRSPGGPRELDGLPTTLPAISAHNVGDRVTFSTIWDPASIEPAAFWEASITDAGGIDVGAPYAVTGRVGQATFPLEDLGPDPGETTGSNPVWQAARSGTVIVYAIESGVLVADVSGPEACALAFLQTSPGDRRMLATAVAIRGATAYVAADGLYVIDLSDPRRPQLVERVPGPGGNAALANGGTLYVIEGETLYVYDLAQPTRPRLVGSVVLPGRTVILRQALAFAAGRLFVAAGDAGVIAVDVSDPRRPVVAGRLPVLGRAQTVTSDGSRLYVGTDEAGLLVVEWDSATESGTRTGAQPAAWSGIAAAIAGPAEDSPPTTAAGASGCVVSNTRDEGANSLRGCLQLIGAGESVVFDPTIFSPSDPATIRVSSELAWEARGVTIDGAGGVILDGGGGGNAFFLKGPTYATIRGLTIRGFNTAITLVGLDNTRDGNVIENNVISGNGFDLHLVHASGNRIAGNRIGVDASATRIIGLPGHEFNDIDFEAGSRMNQIVENTFGASVYVVDAGSSNNAFIGNRFGVDPSGRPLDCECRLYIGEPYNQIGGLNPDDGNVLGGGLTLSGASFALGNELGGRSASSSDERPVVMISGRGNVVGGRAPGAANRVTGAVAIEVGAGSRENAIVDNVTGGSVGRLLEVGIAIGGSDNFVLGNEVIGASVVGVRLRAGASQNIVAWNRILAGGVEGEDRGTGNAWDLDGQGNLWSGFVGRDVDDDGVSDEPRSVPPNGTDRFPLLE